MLIDVLGCDGTYPGPGSATSGFLVRDGRTSVWMDAGTGTLAQLTNRIGLAELSAIVISHSHVDHCADLAIYHHAAAYGPVQLPAVPLYAPEGVLDRVVACNSGSVASFHHHLVAAGSRVELGSLLFEFGPVTHSVAAVATRITGGTGSVVYTGDTSWDDDLVTFAAGCDVLLAEATIVGPDEGDSSHHSATETGRLAAQAGASSLVLTHIPPHSSREQAVRQAAREFTGIVSAAESGMIIEVGNQ